MSNEIIEGTVIDSTPARQSSAMTNPYLAMAQQALSAGQVEHVEKLLDLQFKWEANEQRKAFVSAMSDFKAEPITIVKAKRVSFKTSSGFTEYDHAELVDVTNAIVPAMARHGLSHRWTVKQEGGAITVECVVTHRNGHSESVSMTAPPDTSGGKNTIQSIASTKTYLERYTLLAATGVATGGELDNDGRGDPNHSEYADEPEPDYSDWLAGIDEKIDMAGLQSIKAELKAKFGSAVPRVILARYSDRVDALRPDA